MAESGSEAVRATMQEARAWFMCRVGYVETARVVGLAAGDNVVRRFAEEWPAFGVIEVDQDLAERAAGLARDGGLRSLDALTSPLRYCCRGRSCSSPRGTSACMTAHEVTG